MHTKPAIAQMEISRYKGTIFYVYKICIPGYYTEMLCRKMNAS